jgi:hypothetical protein
LSVGVVELSPVVVGVCVVTTVFWVSSRKTMARLGPGAVNIHPLLEQPVRFTLGVA